MRNLALFLGLCLFAQPPSGLSPKELLNASGVALDRGNYTVAVQQATAAAIGFERDGNTTLLVEALNTAGAAFLYQGKYAEARPQFDKALVLARQSRDAGTEIRLLNNLGNVDFFLGRYAAAFESYQAASQRLKNLESEPWHSQRKRQTLTNLAVLHLQLGQNRRALELCRQALALPAGDEPANERAQILTNLAVAYRRLGDPYKALDRYHEAQLLLQEDPSAAASLYALHNIGVVQALDVGDLNAALQTFSTALRLAENSGNQHETSIEHLYLGETLLRMKRFAAAREEFRKALALNSENSSHRWTALFGLGKSYELEGDSGMALEHHQQALRTIEALRDSLSVSSLKAEFLADKRDVYDAVILGLLRVRIPMTTSSQVFHHIEQARARNLKESASVTGANIDLESVEKSLPNDTALLEYCLTSDRIIALWITRKGTRLVHAPLAAGQREVLETLAQALTSSRAPWKDLASEASKTLLSPAWNFDANGIQKLVIVPDGILHSIPFEILQWPQGNRVIERFDVSYLPSAHFLPRAKPPSPRRWPWQTQTVVFADPLPAGASQSSLFDSAPRLLRSAAEARAIAKALPGAARLLIGSDNLKRHLFEIDSDIPVLHFATHAAVDTTDSRRSRMQFTPEADDASSQYLFSNEVARLKLGNVDLVTLAACDSERGRYVRGEGPDSLSRAFLGAGASASVSSLWRVTDSAAEHLMASFYSHLARGDTKASALRKAKLEFLNSGAKQAGPYYWAAFLLTGDGHVPLARVVPWWQLAMPLVVATILWFVLRRGR
jgi:CHAT domain-containing protein/Flp pilus assembly protein TadD